MNNFQGEEEEKKDQPEKDKEHEKGHEKEQDTSHGDHKKKTSEERRHHHGKHAKHLAPGESSGQRVRNYRKNDQKCYLLKMLSTKRTTFYFKFNLYTVLFF